VFTRLKAEKWLKEQTFEGERAYLDLIQSKMHYGKW
jgi:hypothetical protein